MTDEGTTFAEDIINIAARRKHDHERITHLTQALEEIIRREASSEYTSIYSAPGEFARIARDALGRT